MIKKLISGGQTGADRAALDVAIKFDIPHGGWIPKGRKAEDGPLAEIYRLKEMPTASYPKRTEQNVLDSDGYWGRSSDSRICPLPKASIRDPRLFAALSSQIS